MFKFFHLLLKITCPAVPKDPNNTLNELYSYSTVLENDMFLSLSGRRSSSDRFLETKIVCCVWVGVIQKSSQSGINMFRVFARTCSHNPARSSFSYWWILDQAKAFWDFNQNEFWQSSGFSLSDALNPLVITPARHFTCFGICNGDSWPRNSFLKCFFPAVKIRLKLLA